MHFLIPAGHFRRYRSARRIPLTEVFAPFAAEMMWERSHTHSKALYYVL